MDIKARVRSITEIIQYFLTGYMFLPNGGVVVYNVIAKDLIGSKILQTSLHFIPVAPNLPNHLDWKFLPRPSWGTQLHLQVPCLLFRYNINFHHPLLARYPTFSKRKAGTMMPDFPLILTIKCLSSITSRILL